MPELPKLRVKSFPGYPNDDIRDFEQAEYLPYPDVLIFLEGQRVNSYDEFIQLATQDSYQERQFLEVMILSAGLIDGG